MPAKRIRAIISDIGRVIIGVDVSRSVASLSSGISLSPKETWAAIENDPRWPDLQEGRISARDWHLHIVRRLGANLTWEQFQQAWNLALLPEPLQPDSLWPALAKNYRLALLSNTDPIHVAHMESTYSFFKYFPVRIYSCVVGASKPSPVVYLEALRASKVQSNEAVFIDDIKENVDAAKALGMTGIHCTAPETLTSSLRELGINIP